MPRSGLIEQISDDPGAPRIDFDLIDLGGDRPDFQGNEQDDVLSAALSAGEIIVAWRLTCRRAHALERERVNSDAGSQRQDALAWTVTVVPDGVSSGVTEIVWGPYQEHHIAVRHDVTAELFEAAWVERVDLVVRDDGSYESVGATDDGREVYLVWRWDIFDSECVFPITAYFLPDEG